ncbi:MAG: hypothetical protein WBY88_04720 [Desulfosarcina sp.]
MTSTSGQIKYFNYLLGEPLDPEWIERLADYILDFSLAGINAAGRGRT